MLPPPGRSEAMRRARALGAPGGAARRVGSRAGSGRGGARRTRSRPGPPAACLSLVAPATVWLLLRPAARRRSEPPARQPAETSRRRARGAADPRDNSPRGPPRAPEGAPRNIGHLRRPPPQPPGAPLPGTTVHGRRGAGGSSPEQRSQSRAGGRSSPEKGRGGGNWAGPARPITRRRRSRPPFSPGIGAVPLPRPGGRTPVPAAAARRAAREARGGAPTPLARADPAGNQSGGLLLLNEPP